MIQEGLIAEGESIVAAIRARHDGAARNPWNEPECGDHYARALASYGLLQAYGRSHFDLSRGRISLSPQTQRNHFRTFFAVEGAWGTLALDGATLTVSLGGGRLALREIEVDGRTHTVDAVVTPSQPLHLHLAA